MPLHRLGLLERIRAVGRRRHVRVRKIPAEVVDRISQTKPVHPRAEVLHICQNREREKNFLRKHQYPHVPFAIVSNQTELDVALESIGTPCGSEKCRLRLRRERTAKINQGDRFDYSQFGAARAVLEKWIPFDREISVICARNGKGEVCVFPASENVHTRHILDYSIVPARIDPEVQRRASLLRKISPVIWTSLASLRWNFS